MRLNYDTFTGRRSAFVCVAFVLILLSWAAFVVCSQEITKFLSSYLTGNRLLAAQLLIQNGLVVASVLVAALCTERKRPLKEKLGLDAAGGERFDAVLDGMNEQLYDTMQSLATLIAQQGKMTPELGLRMMGDATTIMAETYEKLGACVPDARRGEVSEMQVFEFIDPGVAEPLIAVQDKLEKFSLSPRPGGRR